MWAEAKGPNAGSQEMPWDPTVDFKMMKRNTDNFFRLFKCYKPTICKVHRVAVAGGSDIALSCDLVVMAKDAKIGYPPARLWGCPTTAMWVYRIGMERAKRMLLTGETGRSRPGLPRRVPSGDGRHSSRRRDGDEQRPPVRRSTP
jgi:enoyl-CoA hydratase